MGTKRLGVFDLPISDVKNKKWFVTRVMGMCSIYRAECMIMRDSIEYIAECNLFDEISEGEIAPSYKVQINDDGSIEAIRK